MFSREPCGSYSCSGASSHWSSITLDSEVLKMLLAAMWHPMEQVMPQVSAPVGDDKFAEIHRLISSLEETADVRQR